MLSALRKRKTFTAYFPQNRVESIGVCEESMMMMNLV